MNAEATLTLDELETLFEALKEGGTPPLPEALEEAIAKAKGKGLNANQLIECLNDYGMETTEALNNWIKERF